MKDRTEPTIAELNRWTVGLDGELKQRDVKAAGGQNKVLGSVLSDFETILGRPMEVCDINPDVAIMLILKMKRDGARQRGMRARYDWFVGRAETAFRLGWLPRQDFDDVKELFAKSAGFGTASPLPAANVGSAAGTIANISLSELLEIHYIPSRLIGKSQNTLRLYRNTIRKLNRWAGRDFMVADLNVQTCARYIGDLMASGTLSPHTIEKEATQLRALWNFAYRKRMHTDAPEIAPVSCPDRIPDAWTRDEMVALMKACESAKGMIGKIEASKFWPALVSLIYDCGERISAVMQIRRDDIDSQGWVTVRGEYRKGKTRDKRYKLRPETVARINAIKVIGEPLILPWPMSEHYLWPKFGEVLKAAGLPSNRRTKFHKIRRTCASDFEAAGGNATKLLDHDNRRTTMRYLDPRVIREVQPADIVPGIGQEVAANE
ncbi:site-specific tyrosine recombinase XerD [Crateriforma conspicua]|uniref:Site-specific tyrosine recombinase XerD n=1 Tax=Crateriforma conspicua TaxID=2527996 RepID=A0A5C6FV74_9PLAN|nr:site-specific integrase [Crateriforma conspicua]TWU66897.1 site-specific tyrosine recombinase XerD [Crateriforma conspicua]